MCYSLSGCYLSSSESRGFRRLADKEIVKARNMDKEQEKNVLADPAAERTATGVTAENLTGTKGKAVGLWQELLFLLLKLATIALMIVLVFTFLFGISRTTDASMNPSVKDGDLTIFDRLSKDYVKSDVVAVRFEGAKQVRRVIAVAGDTVDITEEGLFINGSLQQEHEIREKTLRYDTGISFPLKVGDEEVFLLGDGREHAVDSRVYGCVKVKDTLGKVIMVIRRRGI